MLLTLCQLPAWSIILMVLGFLFICVVLVLTVLIQKPQGGGLAGAFGSAAGSGQTAFGAKTGDALTIFTISMFVVYVLAAIGLNYVVKPTKAEAAPPAAQPHSPRLPNQPAQARATTSRLKVMACCRRASIETIRPARRRVRSGASPDRSRGG